MKLDEELKTVISKTPETTIVKEKALNKGMKTLVIDGIQKAIKGITTLEEVLQTTKV